MIEKQSNSASGVLVTRNVSYVEKIVQIYPVDPNFATAATKVGASRHLVSSKLVAAVATALSLHSVTISTVKLLEIGVRQAVRRNKVTERIIELISISQASMLGLRPLPSLVRVSLRPFWWSSLALVL